MLGAMAARMIEQFMASALRTMLISAIAVLPGLGLTLNAMPQSQADDAQFALVEGAVINAQNSRTIPRASVMLQGVHGVGNKSVRADGNGHFIFQHVEPGKYKLLAERQGFYSDESRRDYQPMIDVAAGEYLKNVPVRLMPTATVTGEIVDEYNDDLENVEVTLLASETRLGQMFLRPAAKSITDDRGQYRIAGLRPGRYYLVAEYKSKAAALKNSAEETVSLAVSASTAQRGERVQSDVTPLPPDPPFTYAPLFYPATGDFKQAQALRLNPGDETPANFVFITAPVVSITGRVTNGMTGAPAGAASVSAFWSEYMQGDGIPARVSHEDGTFEIRGLAPGSYTVRANFVEDKDTYTGEQTIEVGPHGAQNVEIAALPDFAAAGHVTLAGDPPKEFRRVLIEFVGQGLLPRVRASATLPEMKFEAQLRPEKRYYAHVRNLPDDYYLKAVAISGHEVPADNVTVNGRRGDLELVLSPNGAQLEGTLFDSKDQPTRGSVLLVPDLPDPGPPELLRRASAGSDGTFTFRGITPGSYRVVAMESLNLSEQLNEPDFIRKLAGMGTSLLVEEQGRHKIFLRLESAEKQ
jgi:carboxypeptidase family protein